MRRSHKKPPGYRRWMPMDHHNDLEAYRAGAV